MNDRYLYRAKHMHALSGNEHLDGKWIEGYLASENYIFSPTLEAEFLIDQSTICQCTGLKDKNGKLIFEHDIIKCKGIITAVSWDTKYASWVLTKKGWMYHHFFGESQDPEECEIIGNIFDNPEMLEVIG